MKKSEAFKNRRIILIQNDLTDTKIGELLGITVQAVNNELRSPGKSARIREAICTMTKVEPEVFWPELYEREGVVCDDGKAACN